MKLQVPAAIKSLYSDPLPEVCETPPLSESLVGAAEVCQWWRNEEKKRREEFASLVSSASSNTLLLTPSHQQDKVYIVF